MTCQSTKFVVALVLLPAILLAAAVPVFAQTIAPNPSGQADDTAAQVANAQQIAAQIGGCESNGVSLSRPWVGRGTQLEWYAWGFAYGTSVGVQLVEPTGKRNAMSSFLADGLCEGGGTIPTENRPSGIYTLVISGTRPGGTHVELATAFHIVTLGRQGPG